LYGWCLPPPPMPMASPLSQVHTTSPADMRLFPFFPKLQLVSFQVPSIIPLPCVAANLCKFPSACSPDFRAESRGFFAVCRNILCHEVGTANNGLCSSLPYCIFSLVLFIGGTFFFPVGVGWLPSGQGETVLPRSFSDRLSPLKRSHLPK